MHAIAIALRGQLKLDGKNFIADDIIHFGCRTSNEVGIELKASPVKLAFIVVENAMLVEKNHQ